MAQTRRVYQIAEKIRSTVAMHLLQVADPRFSFVTITNVMVSPDLRHAKIYWVCSERDRKEEIAEAFDSARLRFQRQVGKDLGIRFCPELAFYFDDTLDTTEEVNRLFERVEKDRLEREASAITLPSTEEKKTEE